MDLGVLQACMRAWRTHKISEGGRRKRAPEMNFRGVIKADLLAFNKSTESWMELAENWNEWRYLVIAGKYCVSSGLYD
jgi:hypothetical protein